MSEDEFEYDQEEDEEFVEDEYDFRDDEPNELEQQEELPFEKEYVEEKSYECLKRADIIKRQESALKQVESVSSLPSYYARIVLQSYRWDVMRLLNDWSENPNEVCKTAGIPSPDQTIFKKVTNTDNVCQICYDEVKPEDLTSLACGHCFCSDCWKSYLQLEIKEKKKMITCPGRAEKSRCTFVVDEFTVIKLLNDKEAEERYLDALVSSFVEDNPGVKWCPSPGCKNAILLKEVNQDHNEAVVCDCGHSFCFRCNEDDHRPSICNMSKEWRKKNTGGDEELDQQLIATIARPCPRCSASVEKNGGCNHMMCTQCQFHFCWQCMQKFGSGTKGGQDGYSNHKCNNFYKEDDEIVHKQEELKRFQWYSERYNNHHKSMVQEKKELTNSDGIVKQLIDDLQLSWISAQFYTNAIKQLIKNRQVMKYSYVFGYFRPLMTPYVNKNIFENLQVDLERHTEKLANLIEAKSVSELNSTYQDIINETKIADKVKESLLSAASDWSNPVFEKTEKKLTNSTKRRKGAKLKESTDDSNWEAERRQLERREIAAREEEELKKAIEASKSDFGNDMDWELELAIQASMNQK